MKQESLSLARADALPKETPQFSCRAFSISRTTFDRHRI
jgi:hypothetical protein